MNFNDTAQSVKLPRAYRDALADRAVSGSIMIPARDLAILTEG
jgi:hypothetical protein